VYLNTATMALGAAPVREAYEQALAEWVSGRFDYTAAERAGEDCRRLFAGLIGATADEVALVPSVSAAAGAVAAQLGPAKTGENVVVGAQEFSSNYFPWLLLRDRGYEIRTVPFVNGAPRVEDYASAADPRTRLLAVSAVQSATGAAVDLAALADLVHRGGGWIFVDACQAAGAVPLDARATKLDFLAAASHKFLCGTRGMGYLFARSELAPALRPIGPGWKAARDPLGSGYGPSMDLSPTASKLDASLAWFAGVGERNALGIFEELGTERIFEHNRGLVRRLRERLAADGWTLAGGPGDARSTIVSVPVEDPEGALGRLSEARVVASAPAGRLRLSLHLYNSPDDVDVVADLLSKERPR
jgi:selenocysteine lyase/cysteine desulfurase